MRGKKQTGSKHNSGHGVPGDWRLIHSLIVLTAVSAGLSITQSQIIGTHFHWMSLGLAFAFCLLTGQYWRGFLVLIAALATLSVFQAGIILGYRSWYYITTFAGVYVSVRIGADYFKMPGFRWWLLLLAMGTARLFFVESPDAFEYSRGAVLQIATGLSALAIAWQVSGHREYREAITQLSFLVMTVCSISLIVPLYLTESKQTRMGVGIGMDANGLGLIATCAFIALLFHTMPGRKARSSIINGMVTLLLVVVLVRTGSRQAIVTNLLIMLLLVVISLRARIGARILLVIVCVIAGLIFFISAGEIRYLQTRFERAFGEEGKIDRVDHLILSLHMVKDHPLGLGGGGFRENFEQYKHKAGIESVHVRPNPHTFFGMVLSEWGLPGIFLLLMGFYALARHILRLRGLPLVIKGISLAAYLILANAGLVFPPVLMAFAGLREPDENNVASRIRIYW